MNRLIPVLFCLSLPLIAADSLSFEFVKTPAGPNALAPNLCPLGDHFALSWIERKRNGDTRFQMASWNGSAFGKMNLVAESRQMFANWADIPSIVEAPSGDLYAHWLDRIGSKTYAYGVRIKRSTNRGETWKSVGWLHNDTSATEHGFVSLIPDGRHVRAFWLDGRMMTKPKGKMMLRTAILNGNQIKGERVLDDDVCTCCPTSAVQLAGRSMIVYRDRSPKEIRDISFIHGSGLKWSKPSTIQADNWLMPGCPVNGASIASGGGFIAISRFTVIKNKAHVILRLFKEGAIKSGKEIVLDKNAPLGRCATACAKDSIYTVWIGLKNNQTVLKLAQVHPSGEIKRQSILAPIKGNRSSGMPRIILCNGYLWVSWTEENRIRLGRLKTSG
jgi:hypothetical protein